MPDLPQASCSVGRTANYHRIKCSGCGEYNLACTLEMALNDHQLDLEASRTRLTLLRMNTAVPILIAYDCDLLLPKGAAVLPVAKPKAQGLRSA
jgi:hypothetical protein